MQEKSERKQADSDTLVELVVTALDDLKAQSIKSLDVRHLTSVTDAMVIASGRSNRHVRAVSESLVERCREAGHRPTGIEGGDTGEWVLVDLTDVVVHVMLPKVREFYNLEGLWDIPASREVMEH